jgi:DNA repair protein RecN (Recombination protein N)
MLYALHIKNFAIVEQLELEFQDGLTIISGETGAGKSILVDALGLVLGGRADTDMVRQGCEEAEISAAFDASETAQAWLRQMDFASNGDCLLRRIVSANGRTRGYINGHLATMQALRELGELLVEIHSQHAHQTLLKLDTQRETLDLAGDCGAALEKTLAAWRQWKELRDALHNLGGNAADREARIALLRYQVQEFEALELDGLADLDAEHRRLAHASQLLEAGERGLQLLDGDRAALVALHHAAREISAAQAHDARLAPIAELLDSAIIQAEEAVGELRHYVDRLEVDPARLQQVEQRIAALQTMARKHRVAVEELAGHSAELSQQLQDLEHYEERAAQLEKNLAAGLRDYRKAAGELSEQRRKAAETLAQSITATIRQLGMPRGQLVIQVSPRPDADPAAHGLDMVEFLVSANPGQDPRPLAKVASGGELSRISLAIQVITAQSAGVLVFDEVDVGIGGGVAEIVGQQLADLSRGRQVLCITHQPQVAAYGKQHWQVSKAVRDDQTFTAVQALKGKKRVQEVARMLGGLEITEQTIAHAGEMLERGVAWKGIAR